MLLDEATASNNDVRLFFVVRRDLDIFLSLPPLPIFDPDNDDSHDADFSSNDVAGDVIDNLLFLLRFLSSLIGVAGTDADGTRSTTTLATTGVSSTSS